jgi:CubicO group peptidase (beta-lactamase class C family)
LDFNTLGAIYERAVRSSIFDAFEREIAGQSACRIIVQPTVKYVTGGASVYPAYPFKMSARDLARFALLYLRKGQWEGRQIVQLAGSRRAYNPTRVGMGPWLRLFVVDRLNQQRRCALRQPAEGHLLCPGYGGQYAFVIPAFDLVVVIVRLTRTKARTSGKSADFSGSCSMRESFLTSDPTRRSSRPNTRARSATRSLGCFQERLYFTATRQCTALSHSAQYRWQRRRSARERANRA